MQFNYKKEMAPAAAALFPLVYLAMIWTSLPDTVPVHWNLEGEPDGFASKNNLMLVPFLLPILTYLILLVVYYINPQGKLQAMGDKFHDVKFILVFLMSALSVYMIYSAKGGSTSNPNVVTIIIGVFLVFMGNYMQTIRRNFFLGYKVPWTLNSDRNWKLTHALSGKLWMIGGLVVVIAGLLLSHEANVKVFLMVLAVIITVPLIYSYSIHKRDGKSV